MNNAKKIKMALAYIGMSEAELARRMGTTPQAFGQRMKTDKFSTEELIEIGKILGAEYRYEFLFKDGTRI